MNKKIFKIVLILLATLALYFLLTTPSKAYLSISTSKSTVSPGESFSVTVSVSSNEAGAISLSASNGSLSSTYVDLMSQPSVTISCTAGNSGTVTISGSGKVANYNTETEEQQSASKSVQIATPQQNSGGGSSSNGGGSSSSSSSSGTSSKPKPTTNNEKPKEEEKKSNDTTLKALTVEGFDLYPEFNVDTLEYNIKVPNDITEVSILPTANDSKASANVEGTFTELQVGENIAKIIVTAEDGTTREYVIKINRAREALKVTNIILFYIDEEGNNKELVLTPNFDPEVYEYNLDNLSYLVSKLEIDVLKNLEEAEVEIIGNEELVEGENLITITVKVPSEGEEEDEVVTYKIIVNKEPEPKLGIIGKVKKWFNGIAGTVGSWFNNNQFNIMLASLSLCSATMGGLVVYLAIDYKKYKKLLEKVRDLSKVDNQEVALASESKIETKESIVNKTEPEDTNNDEQIVEEKIFKAKGRHF